jgi:iron(III) transport system ATP-binding protein
MAYVSIEGLTKHFDGKPPTVAVDDLHLEIEQGEFLVLLGPSGCGKTTTLRCLAGLERPAGGRISLGGATVFDGSRRINLPPDKRNIGMVFQSYALWPHMTVRRNIGYPLKARRLTEGLRSGWVEETADLVDCGPLLDRYPAQLSGGQQQRVALARGLVARPDLVLFDEPLSNLDARLRDQVRAELHELHARLGFTAVFVTHDQAEALALGDRLAIMRAGRIEQFDTPERVFDQPATEYVAAFIGMSNQLEVHRRNGDWTIDDVTLGGAPLSPPGSPGAVTVRLRAEDVRLDVATEHARPDEATVAATVVDAEFGGRHMDVIVRAGRTRLHARIPAGPVGGWARGLTTDQAVSVSFAPGDARYFPAGGRTSPADSDAEVPA